jgi:hypothetical protein
MVGTLATVAHYPLQITLFLEVQPAALLVRKVYPKRKYIHDQLF